MQKITQKVCMIILVVWVATAYMVQAAAMYQVDKRDLRQYLLHKRQCSDLGEPCNRSRDCCNYAGHNLGIGPCCDYENGVCVLRQK
jgi:hypothetical protein